MIVAALVLALQAPADADPAGAAAMSFFECAQSFAASTSKAAFVKLEGDLGRSIDADSKMGHMGFAIDDAAGRGCRVTYTGEAAKAARLADAYPQFAKDCPQRQADAGGITCPVGAGSPPFRLEVRQSKAPDGRSVVAATLIDLRP